MFLIRVVADHHLAYSMRIKAYNLEQAKFEDVIRLGEWLGVKYDMSEDSEEEREEFIELLGMHLIDLYCSDRGILR